MKNESGDEFKYRIVTGEVKKIPLLVDISVMVSAIYISLVKVSQMLSFCC